MTSHQTYVTFLLPLLAVVVACLLLYAAKRSAQRIDQRERDGVARRATGG